MSLRAHLWGLCVGTVGWLSVKRFNWEKVVTWPFALQKFPEHLTVSVLECVCVCVCDYLPSERNSDSQSKAYDTTGTRFLLWPSRPGNTDWSTLPLQRLGSKPSKFSSLQPPHCILCKAWISGNFQARNTLEPTSFEMLTCSYSLVYLQACVIKRGMSQPELVESLRQ